MKLYNRFEAAQQIGVSANTVSDWAKQKRIRTLGYVRNQPIFLQKHITEVVEELKHLKRSERPTVKEENVEDEVELVLT